MEFARRGRSTAQADNVHDGRRPPPPHGGDAGLAVSEQGNVAALARTREALLWELREERIRQKMILRELAETERAMAACFAAGHQPTQTPTLRWPPGDWLSTPAAAWDAWHGRASMPPWEEAPLRAPWPSEQPSWWRGSPSAVRVPLYPHVERSPSPTPQALQADDAEQQGRGRSSSARAPPLHPYVEQCGPLSSKEPAAEEALVPVTGNADAKLKEPALFGKELIPQRHDAVGQERQAEAEDSHADAVQPAEFITGDRIDERVQPPRQYMPAAQDYPTFDEQKRLEFNESTPKMTSSGVKRKLTAGTSPVKKQKPLGEWSCSLCQVNTTGARNLAEHCGGQLHRSNLAAQQSRQRTAELNAKPTPESSHGAHQKRPLPLPGWGCSICDARCATKADLEKHRGSWLHRRNAQSLLRNGDKNTVESSESQEEEWFRDKAVPQPAGKSQKPPSNWSCSICEAKCTSESDLQDHLRGRRHREKTEALHAQGKNEEEAKCASNGVMNRRSLYFCEDCSVQCNSEKMLASHLGGRRHRETLQGRH